MSSGSTAKELRLQQRTQHHTSNGSKRVSGGEHGVLNWCPPSAPEASRYEPRGTDNIYIYIHIFVSAARLIARRFRRRGGGTNSVPHVLRCLLASTRLVCRTVYAVWSRSSFALEPELTSVGEASGPPLSSSSESRSVVCY